MGLLFFSLAPAFGQANEFRALWVDAWGTGFLNASEVTQLIADCRTYNFNAVVVQMRRRGDAFYTPGISGNDPKTTAISSGFDALQDLINKAHAGSPRIEVHCWVTTQLIWSSQTTPPPQAGHVHNLHPEYLTRNSAGQQFIGEGYYLDPGHPDATMWNYVMATNIVRRYDVDGFNWDYIRYPTTDSGFNPTAVARYNAEFGLTGQPSASDTQFSNWRRRQITDFLRWVNSELLAIRPGVQISCDVFGSRSDAFNARFQDWAAWNSEGIIDICLPMGYTDSLSLFQSRCDDAFTHQGVRRVYEGQGGYLNTKEATLAQLLYARNKPLLGTIIYDYGTPGSVDDRATTLTYLRDNFQPTWVNTPALPWKATPTKAIVRGTVTRQGGGTAVYNATLTINTAPARNQRTEPHGKFAFFETPPGTYTITATGTDLGVVTTNITVTAGMNLAISLMLPPDSTPPIISGAGTSNLTDASVIIKWTTDENSDSAVDFGLTTAYGGTVSNATMTLNHEINLAGLTPNTTYHFRVRSRTAANLPGTSGDFVFVTNPSGVVSDIIIDDAAATLTGSWTSSSASPGYYGTGYRYKGAGTGSAYAEFRPDVLTAGNYKVYVWFVSGGNRTTGGPHLISYNGGTQTVSVNQQINGSQWFLLGTFNFAVGTTGYVRVRDDFTIGSVVMADAIRFEYIPPPQPPTITNQPLGRAVNQGSNTTFTAGVSGATPFSYQWRRDGTNIAGATLSSYTINNVQPAHEGDYSVVVTNIAGSAASADAFLVVNLAPYIGVQPQNQTTNLGSDVTFFVAAGGTEPFSYQWRFNGSNIAGATSDRYTRNHVQTNDAGNYSVVITNVAGTVNSSDAFLAVTLPQAPVIQAISVLPDGRARLTFSGEIGASYSIEGSSNLTDWIEMKTGLLTNSTADFLDGSAPNAPVRFYRVGQ